VAAVASLVTLAVMLVFALALHRRVRSAVESWERRQSAALAHHLATMLDNVPLGERKAALEQVGSPLAQFGVSARMVSSDAPEVAWGSVVPLAEGSAVLVSTNATGEKLAARLAPLYLGLTGGLLAALLLAVQGSIYLGLTRPLRAVERQIAQMRRGRWKVAAPPASVAEMAVLGARLESFGEELELKVEQWVEAERRAGFELARCRIRRQTLELGRDSRRFGEELLANEALRESSRSALRGVLEAIAELESLLMRPPEELGLGPPAWSAASPMEIRNEAGVESERS